MGEHAEEAAEMAARFFEPNAYCGATPLMHEGVPEGANVMHMVQPGEVDGTMCSEGINQITRVRMARTVERGFPRLAQSRFELGEDSNEIGGFKVIPEVLIIPKLEPFDIKRGGVPAKTLLKPRGRD
jgi:hypothetical protein